MGRVSLLFLSPAGERSLYKHLGNAVGDESPARGEDEPVFGGGGDFFFDEFADDIAVGFEQGEIDSFAGAQAEHDAFAAADLRGEVFDFGAEAFVAVDPYDVRFGIFKVFPALGADGGAGTGADAEVVGSEPVGLVVE